MSLPSTKDAAEYAAASMIDVAISSKQEGGLRIACEELAHHLYRTYGVEFEADELESAQQLLVGIGLAEIVEVGHSRPYFFVSSSIFGARTIPGWDSLGTKNALRSHPIISAYKKLGRGWLRESLRAAYKFQIAERARMQGELIDKLAGARKLKLVDSADVIPASDRVVAIDHNSREVKEIIKSASSLEAALKSANNLGNLSTEEAEAAHSEVKQISAAFLSNYVRPKRVFAHAKAALSWIGAQAAGALIGTAAMALLALITAFFGYSL